MASGFSCLPLDVLEKILVSFLPARDVMTLGKCGRYLWKVCGSDTVWISISRKRWPSLFALPLEAIPKSPLTDPNIEGWKDFYISRHRSMYGLGLSFLNYRRLRSDPLRLNARSALRLASSHFGFTDVVLILFDSYAELILNMIGLYYSIVWLKVPRIQVAEALRSCKIQDKEVKLYRDSNSRCMFKALVRKENRDSLLTLEDVALGRRGRTPAKPNAVLL